MSPKTTPTAPSVRTGAPCTTLVEEFATDADICLSLDLLITTANRDGPQANRFHRHGPQHLHQARLIISITRPITITAKNDGGSCKTNAKLAGLNSVTGTRTYARRPGCLRKLVGSHCVGYACRILKTRRTRYEKISQAGIAADPPNANNRRNARSR